MSTDRPIKRRSFLGAGGLVAASALGAGAVGLGATAAHASSLVEVDHENFGRLQYYRFSTPSIAWNPGVNVLLPDGYDPGKRYPVLYLLHGGTGNFTNFHLHHDIINLTAGRQLIVVMPDGGFAGWYSNPAERSKFGPRNWETFHIEELIPWVDATFPTYAEYAGRAVSGFSMGGFGALKYAAKYYGHFASVSSHSGPASIRKNYGAVAVADYINLTSLAETGTPLYGQPWREDLVTADNAVERIDSFRNKRIFLVAGTDRSPLFDGKINPPRIEDLNKSFWDLQEQHVADGHRDFANLLNQAGIPHIRHEEPGGHILRHHRLQEDIDGVVAHLKKAG